MTTDYVNVSLPLRILVDAVSFGGATERWRAAIYPPETGGQIWSSREGAFATREAALRAARAEARRIGRSMRERAARRAS